MLNLEKLSIGYFFELTISHNQVKMKLLSVDKLIQVECNVIIFMSVENQDEEVEENGNIVDVVHEYRVLNSNELQNYKLYNYKFGDFCHIIDIYGDYVIKIIFNDINVIELS